MRIALVGVLFAILASTADAASATHWFWTESYAEKRVEATISYEYKPAMPPGCQQGIQDRQASVDQAKAVLQQAEVTGNPAQIQGARQTLLGAQAQLQTYKDGCEMTTAVKVYKPTDVVCTGIGSAVGGIRFSRFRCIVTFLGGAAHMHVLATVTGRTSLRWQVI